MKSISPLHPMVPAIAGALALLAGTAQAQVFDPNSAAVRQAYVGAADYTKTQTATFGFEQIGGVLPLLPQEPRTSSSTHWLNPFLGSLNVPAGTTVNLSSPTATTGYASITGSGSVQIGTNILSIVAGGGNFAGSIAGLGGLSVVRSSLGLSGINSYAGITRISDGTLSLIGTGRLDPSARISLFADYGSSATFDISRADGSREIESINSPTRVFLGLTTINLGSNTLTVGRNGASSSIGDAIIGSGSLVKEGPGTLEILGPNSLGGTLTVNGGIVRAQVRGLNSLIINNATLVLLPLEYADGVGDSNYFKLSVYSGAISGTGQLIKEGTHAIWLRGRNTYTGGTTVTSGVLIGNTDSLQGNIVNHSGLAFYQVDNGAYAGVVSGSGTLLQYGPGTLTLTGNNTYTGPTFVGGRLDVAGSITSNVTVMAGAELGVTGFITGNVVNHGRLLRGNGIGLINVAGSVSFEPGSLFTVKTDARGNSDRLMLSGAGAQATLRGGTVDVRTENYNYRRETRYNIVTAEGGVSGQFAGVTSNLAFLSPRLSYDSNNVYLALQRNDVSYASVAQNAGQSSVSRLLAHMAESPDSYLVNAIASLDGLSAPQARAAFDSIGAAGMAAMPQMGTFNQRSVHQNLVARLGIAEGGDTLAPATGVAGRAVQVAFDDRIKSDAPLIYAQAATPGSGQGLRAGPANDAGNGFWLRGYGGTGRIDGDASTPGAKYHFGGTLLGYDRRISDGATLGAFGGYAEPRYEQELAASSARGKSYQLGGYGRVRSGAWHVDGVASYARNNTDTSRVVTVGALSRAAAGSFNGDTVAVHLETGYTIKTGGFDLQPLAALSWVRQTQNAYSETGAGAFNLLLPNQRQESLRSSLGLRSVHPFQAGATQAVFEARAAWSHEFKNTRDINARLAGDPAAGVFTISGPSLPRDSAVVGVGIAAQASRNLRLYADVNGEFNGRERAGTLSVGLRYQW
jgi:outer membrane autotransporter protein